MEGHLIAEWYEQSRLRCFGPRVPTPAGPELDSLVSRYICLCFDCNSQARTDLFKGFGRLG